MKIEEEARKFMQDRLIITEVMTADFYESQAGQTAIFPKEKALGVPLGDIMQDNLNKLHGRKERGTLQGSGDDR